MKVSIPDNIINDILLIVKELNKNGYECYLIGGSVRDLVLGQAVSDFDFATNACPEEVARVFKRVIPTGIKHGTVTVLLREKQFEVTTYRFDGKYIDGRRPECVKFSKTLDEDVRRRDFTINGLGYDIHKEEIIDFVDGMEDLEKGIIKTIGDPLERFGEDGLRSLRACRFAAKLNFEIEDETFNAISKTLNISRLVSAERVRDELIKLLFTDKPSIGFEYMRNSGLLKLFIPELYNCYKVNQNKYHLYDVYYHSLYSCDAVSRDNIMVRLAALFHDVGKVATREGENDVDCTFYNHEVMGARLVKKLMIRLKFSNEEILEVTNLIVNHMFHYLDEWTDGAVRRFIKKVGLDNMDNLFLLRLADRIGNGMRKGIPAPINELKKRIEKIIKEENALNVKDLDIDGNIIMKEFDFKPGPLVGRLLNDLLEFVLDNPEMNEREILVSKSHEIYNKIGSEFQRD